MSHQTSFSINILSFCYFRQLLNNEIRRRIQEGQQKQSQQQQQQQQQDGSKHNLDSEHQNVLELENNHQNWSEWLIVIFVAVGSTLQNRCLIIGLIIGPSILSIVHIHIYIHTTYFWNHFTESDTNWPHKIRFFVVVKNKMKILFNSFFSRPVLRAMKNDVSFVIVALFRKFRYWIHEYIILIEIQNTFKSILL